MAVNYADGLLSVVVNSSKRSFWLIWFIMMDGTPKTEKLLHSMNFQFEILASKTLALIKRPLYVKPGINIQDAR